MVRKALARETPASSAVESNSAVSLPELRQQARHCRACPLWANATQTVFGEGNARASIMLVGEQPGDQEDLSGHVFVGPAGQLLNRALDAAGVDRSTLYITNAVKHFKFEPRGKRRLHKKPSDSEIDICNQWLQRELASVKPAVIVAMGATAARGIFHRSMAIGTNRGRILRHDDGTRVIITVHPSYLLRVRGPDRDAQYALFLADLKLAAKQVR